MNIIKKTGSIIILICFILVLSFCQREKGSFEQASLILTNGNIITMENEMPKAEAIAIKDERIIAVGNKKDIEKHKGEQTKEIDLQGKTAVPGLIDSHIHFPLLGKRLKQLYLDQTTSFEQVLDIVADQVKKAKPGEWITGRGWHTVYWKTKEYPDNIELNKISPDNPVFLIGMATHAALVNEKAFQLAGITKKTSDPPGGQISKNQQTVETTCIFLEKAMLLFYKILPTETDE